ncbi:ROK family transcriptional regulator [Alkalicoccus chagannorensis]|uniref:ROK family transcriptional regulator n=1 Tax=Alkalicoccus chagannorensis TaxID=427072 RepID=UPI00041B66E2|nr:ROK family protein [Alkalicoccus chagannorensis]
MKTGDQNLVKKLNKSIVLEMVQKESPISRTQISQSTGLTKATVSSLVGELIEEHFIYEMANGESKGGRRPVMLYFQKEAGFSIGIDLGVDRIIGMLTDLKGHVQHETEYPLQDTTEAVVFATIQQCIDDLIKEAPYSPYGIIGAGIGVPGTVNNNGMIEFAPNLGWAQQPLKHQLEECYDFPIILENEANAGAHGEKVYGSGTETSNLVYVSVGIGIGTGLIIDGDLYRGEKGFSGEMGHMSIEMNGIKCNCGNIGCWELYASESTLLERAALLHSFQSYENISFQDVLQEAEQGNGEVLTLLQTIGTYLGVGVVNIVNTFNPRLVVLGNRFAALEPWLEGPIRQVFQQRLLPYQCDAFDMIFSPLAGRACAMGASSFALSHFFSRYKITLD